MTTAIPISLCIDIEPDKRCIHPTLRSPWSGFEDLYANHLSRYREMLAQATGSPARFCWNMRLDPQIAHTYGTPDWAFQRYRGFLDSLLAAGDEIGLHTHDWRWEPKAGCWVGDHDNAAWIEHCIRSSCRTYEACFGRAPRVFSFGDRFMSNRVMALLEELGIVCDFSIEPGRRAVRGLVPTEKTTGWLPDYRKAPSVPYQPSIRNFRKPGRRRKRNIWVLPVSTGWPDEPNGRKRSRSAERVSMLLGYPFPAMRCILEQNLERPQPYILAIARSDLTLNTFDREQLELFLNHLAEHPMRDRFVFVPPLETLKSVTEGMNLKGMF
jgi:hypothetical protein